MRSSLRSERGSAARTGRFRPFAAIAALVVVLVAILAACSGGSDSSSNSEKKSSDTTELKATLAGALRARARAA